MYVLGWSGNDMSTCPVSFLLDGLTVFNFFTVSGGPEGYKHKSGLAVVTHIVSYNL